MNYYLWKDKKLKPNGDSLYYITDYNEKSLDGKQKIDNHGFLDVNLIGVFTTKEACVQAVQMIHHDTDN